MELRFKTFRGGTHPPEHKEATEHKSIQQASLPEEVVIPLSQHVGAPCDSLVEKGDKVLAGQKIGESKAFVSAPIHASVSGEVVAVEPRLTFTGASLLCVVIRVDKEQKEVPLSGIESLNPEQVRAAVKESGLVGLGGAAFPTHVKLSPPEGKTIDTVIINGCECEPYLTCDHRQILEETEALLDGLKIVMRVLGANKGYFGLESNKPDAIERLQRLTASEKNIEVATLKTKYPQGAEKNLILTILEKEVPSGGLPMDVGALVQNVGTAIAISKAVRQGKPLTERVLTVTGAVKKPQNLRVKIGTLIKDLIEQGGGFTGKPGKIILGGPMTGFAQFSLDVPVVKGTSGVLVLSQEEVYHPQPQPCVRCGRCIRSCPVWLTPASIIAYVEHDRLEEAEEIGVLDCVECGACGYVCPADRPFIQQFRRAKAEILAKKKAESAKQKVKEESKKEKEEKKTG